MFIIWLFDSHMLCYYKLCLLYFGSDYLFKLLLIGDSGVGKSCLLLRFAVNSAFYLILYFFDNYYLVSHSNFWLT